MEEDRHCEGFLEFCRRYGDDIAESMLEDICCREDSRDWPFRIKKMRSESHDREGNNHTISGTIEYKARAWMFEVRSGNWNGTEVESWEQCWLQPCSPPPPQSLWMCMDVRAFIVSLVVQKMMPTVSKLAHATLVQKGPK